MDVFRERYASWDRRRNQNHIYEYYDLSIGQMVHLNGFDYDQCEITEREYPIAIGFGDVFPKCIRRKIEDMR